MQLTISKQKIFEILVTALISATIAFLQSLLIHVPTDVGQDSVPAVAGLVGACIRAYRA